MTRPKSLRVINALPKILLLLPDANGTYAALRTLIIEQFNINAETRIKRAFERKFTNEKPSEILELLRHDLSFSCDAELSISDYEILRTLFHQKIPNQSILPLLVSSNVNYTLSDEAKRADTINEIMCSQNLKAESTNYLPSLPYAINTAPNACSQQINNAYNLQTCQSSQNAAIIPRQTQSTDVNAMSVFTTLLYDIRDSLSKQTENAAKLNEYNIHMSEQLMKQLTNANKNVELITTKKSESAQGTSHMYTGRQRSDNTDWRARDLTAYNNRPQNEANICYAHYYYGRRAKFCQPWCRFKDEFNNLSNQVAGNSKNE